jgi:hypothetical protein
MKGHRSSAVVPCATANVIVRWQPPDIVEAAFHGRVAVRTVEEAIEQIRAERPARYFLLDASEVSGFDPDVRVPGVLLLRTLKDRKIEHAVCVAPAPSVRMIGAAVAFVATVKVDFFPTRREALARLAQKRAESS